MGKEIQIVPSDRPVVQEPIDIPAGVFVRDNKMYAKYTDPETLRTIETDVFDGAGEVLPSPTAEDDGKVLGVADGEYALVEQSGGGSGDTAIITWDLGEIDYDEEPKLQDFYNEFSDKLGETINITFNIKYLKSLYPGATIFAANNFLLGLKKFETSGDDYVIQGSFYDLTSSASKEISDNVSKTEKMSVLGDLALPMPKQPSDIIGKTFNLQIADQQIKWVQSSGGELPFYVINDAISNSTTFQTIIDLIPNYVEENSNFACWLFLKNVSANNTKLNSGLVYFSRYYMGSLVYTLVSTNVYYSSEVIKVSLYTNNKNTTINNATVETYPLKELPSLPFDASTKTYVLKAVNGTLTWVE